MNNMLDFFINIFHSGIVYSRQVDDNKYETVYINSEDILKNFCTLNVPRNTFLSKYELLPEKMDKMAENEKLELKKYVNETFKGETPEFRLNACKVIFTLNQCL